MELYPSDLTDAEWAILEPLIPPEKPGGRPREVDRRAVLNGIFYVLRAGCAWRMIPRDYPPKSTVYSYFARFRNEGVWEQIMARLRERCRREAGREATPSAGIIDSQSVRSTDRGGPHGYDGGKKLSGRKRHIFVDTTGLILQVVVHEADIQDRQGVPLLLEPIKGLFPRMKKVWVDQGYTGKGREWIKEQKGREVEIVRHSWPARGEWVLMGISQTSARCDSRMSASNLNQRNFRASCEALGSRANTVLATDRGGKWPMRAAYNTRKEPFCSGLRSCTKSG